MVNHVLIIGGGFAGIAAATRLAEQRISVTLIEKRPFLGGRTISIRHRETGEWIDNGQHVMMGCYHETFQLLRRIGTHSCLYFQPVLDIHYHGTEGWHDRLRCPRLPGPYHLAAGLFWMKQLKLKDVWRAKKLQHALHDIHPGETVAQLLERTEQTDRMKQFMWENIALSALNETVDAADAHMFAEVLKQAFFGERDDSRLVIPIVGLQKLHEHAAMDYIYERGGYVRTGHEVQELRMNRKRIHEVVFSDGETLTCDAVISAVPAPAWQKIVEQSNLQDSVATPDMGSSPILSVYLWFEKAFTHEKITCAIGSHFEWVFHRSNFMHKNEHKLNCVCLVASAARYFFSCSREELVQKAVYDMHCLYPETQNLKVVSSHVFWERHATFSCTPENIAKRPSHQTNIPNLFLAGDWTNTGLPATIEGAVQSGHRCAELALQI